MRVRREVDQAELRRLVDEQARLAWQVLYWLPRPPARRGWWVATNVSPGGREPDEDAKQRYRHAWNALEERLHVAGFDSWCDEEDWEEFPPCWRFDALGTHPLFPPEWQAHALRTWLPEELPDRTRRWRGYLNAVRSGRHRPYLFERYLHDMSMEVHDLWKLLIETAEATARRTNAWATRPALVELRAHLATLPEPIAAHPAPHWADWEDRHGEVDPERVPAYAVLHRTDQLRVRLTRTLDARLPGSRKIRRYERIPSFEEFLAKADDPWRSALLQWLERCCEQEQGLFLW